MRVIMAGVLVFMGIYQFPCAKPDVVVLESTMGKRRAAGDRTGQQVPVR
jgi:hypothetical protein